MAKKTKGYFRDKARKNRKADKELSRLYHSIESNPGETFTQFKKRKKQELW